MNISKYILIIFMFGLDKPIATCYPDIITCVHGINNISIDHSKFVGGCLPYTKEYAKAYNAKDCEEGFKGS